MSQSVLDFSTGLSETVEAEIEKRIEQEKDSILNWYGRGNPPMRVSEIAKDIISKVILPYVDKHKIELRAAYTRFLGKLRVLELLTSRTNGLGNLDDSVETTLRGMSYELREAFKFLYQGCCDLHFQRINGVEQKRTDSPLDYIPVSRKIRPGAGSPKYNWHYYLRWEEPDKYEVYG